MKHMTGFISANNHLSLNGKKIANYAQCATMADFEAMRKDPKAAPHMHATAAFAQFEPILRELSDAVSAE